MVSRDSESVSSYSFLFYENVRDDCAFCLEYFFFMRVRGITCEQYLL